ncbi:zeta toxin family protein [Streptomyces sp. NPDC054765]
MSSPHCRPCPAPPSAKLAGQAVSGDWSEEVLAGIVLPSVLDGAVPQPRTGRPVVVFVAGQPGSGKTLVVDLVHAALQRRGGAVRVDRDAYKDAHPHYTDALVEDVRTAMAVDRPSLTHLRRTGHALSWSRWRRRHQAIARRCHYRHRTRGHELPQSDGTSAKYTQDHGSDQQG